MRKLEKNCTAFGNKQTRGPVGQEVELSASSAVGPLASSPLSTRVDKIGGAFDDAGVNLHATLGDESTNKPKNLPFGTRFLVESELPGGWYKVRVLGGDDGYVAKHLVRLAPEPGAVLYKVKAGDSVIGIAETHYKKFVKPDEDLRFFVNVLNFVNPTAIPKPALDDSWKKSKALKNYAIWVPCAEFAVSLHGKVGSGSITGGLWAQVRDAGSYVIRTLLEQMPGGKRILTWLEKVGSKLLHVFSHPGRFVENLMGAVQKGFRDFTGNIVANIEDSVVSLLTDSAAGQGIAVPARFDAQGVLSFALDLMGINRASLEQKLAQQGIPAGSLRQIEKISKVGPIIRDIEKNGLAGTLKGFLENIGNVKDMVFGALKDWIVTQVIKQGVLSLLSVLIPGGGLVQLAIKIYDTVKFILDKMNMIKDVVASIAASLSDIVDGKVDAAATKVENSLKSGLTLGLGFLASLAKLGSIANKVKEIIGRIRKSLDNAMNRLAKFVADKARPFLAKGANSNLNQANGTPAKPSGGPAPTTQPDPGPAPVSVHNSSPAALTKPSTGSTAMTKPKAGPAATTTPNAGAAPTTQPGSGPAQTTKPNSGPATTTPANADPATTAKPAADPQHDAKVQTGLAQIDVEEAKLDRDHVGRLTKLQTEQVANIVKRHNPVFTEIIAHYDVAHSEITYEWFASHGSKKSARQPYTDELEPAANEGTLSNPFPIDWPKPASAQYPTIYLGAKRDDYKPQSELSQLVGKADDKGGIVHAYTPHQRATLPGGEQIGLLPNYYLKVGTVLGPIAKAGDSSPGGGTLNKILKGYGFRPREDGLDGDHVHEIQLGGQDVIENMWPLHKSVNRGSGSIIDSADVPLVSGKSIKVYQLRDHVAKTRRAYYFRAKSTNP